MTNENKNQPSEPLEEGCKHERSKCPEHWICADCGEDFSFKGLTYAKETTQVSKSKEVKSHLGHLPQCKYSYPCNCGCKCHRPDPKERILEEFDKEFTLFYEGQMRRMWRVAVEPNEVREWLSQSLDQILSDKIGEVEKKLNEFLEQVSCAKCGNKDYIIMPNPDNLLSPTKGGVG